MKTKKGAVSSQTRLLSVGGIHMFESDSPCRFVRAEPADALRDIGWNDALALRADREGTAEIVCGEERLRAEIVLPARMTIIPVDGKVDGIPVGERIMVRALLHDGRGRELDIGQHTHVDWTASGSVREDDDRSAGEFGFSSTAFGMKTLRAVAPGEGTIEAAFGELRARLTVTISALHE